MVAEGAAIQTSHRDGVASVVLLSSILRRSCRFRVLGYANTYIRGTAVVPAERSRLEIDLDDDPWKIKSEPVFYFI